MLPSRALRALRILHGAGAWAGGGLPSTTEATNTQLGRSSSQKGSQSRQACGYDGSTHFDVGPDE